MPEKQLSPWTRLQRKSGSLRRSFEQVVREFVQLASDETADPIKGAAVAKNETDEWKQTFHSAAQATDGVTSAMERRAAEGLEGLEDRLIRTIRESGITVYGETALLVIEGIVHVEIDVKKATARINGKPSEDMSISGLKRAILAEVDRVRKLVTPPEKFIALLLKAYEAERLHGAKEFGSQLQTSAVLWQLALLRQQPAFRTNPVTANFQEYPREIFRADLFRLLASNLTSTNGKRFRYASGSDTVGAVFMFVPQLGRTAHIGRVWFEHGD